MRVLLTGNVRLPALKYGGTERVMWWLGKALKSLGHEVTFLVAKGSTCPFATVLTRDASRPLAEQIPAGIDIVHANEPVLQDLPRPFLTTVHANLHRKVPLDINSVFISANHARRFGADTYVYHGLDPAEYGKPDFAKPREYLHFLGKAAWKRKNLKGAIEIARLAGERLAVLGGHRVNFKMGFRITLDPRVRFHGMVGGDKKNALLNGSKGLLFPVRWDEPFGLAVIESLYFGAPAFVTPYGSLPELVTSDVGFVSDRYSELANAVTGSSFSARKCHEYVCDQFTSERMARGYVALYERVLNGEKLNAAPPRAPDSEPGYLPG